MTRNGRKRSHDDFRLDNTPSMGETVAHLRRSADAESPKEEGQQPSAGNFDGAGEWHKVERSKKRKKHAKKEGDNYPAIYHSSQNRLQSFVKVGDLQNLVLYLLADGSSPQWCAVRHHGQVRKVVALMVPGLEAGMFDGSIALSPPEQKQENGTTAADSPKLAQNGENIEDPNSTAEDIPPQIVEDRKTVISPDDYYPTRLKHKHLAEPLQPLADTFEHIWPVKAPGDDKYAKMHSPMAGMLIAPLVKPKEEKKFKGAQPPTASRNWNNQRTPITEFIAPTEELVEEGYVLHPANFSGTSSPAENARREADQQTEAEGWVDTPNLPDLAAGMVAHQDIQKGAILAGRKVLTMDCEMCITSPAGTTPAVSSLTRISIIDWDGNVVLDELVKPEQPITDYLTPYSGITPEKLEGVTTTLQDIQKKLVTEIITPHTILVGHSLNSDLNALKLTHPFIIDTSMLFPHPRGPPLKSSLKWLAQKYLSREIQKGHGSTGHDSIEDARACLDLVKQKCEKGKAWGTSEASGESIFKRLGRQKRPKRDKLHPDGEDEFRTGAVVDWGEPARGYGASAKEAIGCESDEQVVTGIKRALAEETDGRISHERGVDFVFARLRELEAHRGWWTKSKSADNQSLLDTTTSSTSSDTLADVIAQTVARIQAVYEALPPCSTLIVFSGSGDPRELANMQALQQKFKEEYRVKKWDELSVKWTDDEEQKLRKACEKARKGVGFVAVK
ncbi:hypothetical protein LTR09_008675 [Extremus antarcticus]|uniref:Exonuclease domain-containing protein n=1 Tax=Extremus antarcticus TaxID=702011 RepID=A0AAJ0DH24_9PEZI|nr:hypothetical protein LTR09_008675 [Extremus antarcticus]